MYMTNKVEIEGYIINIFKKEEVEMNNAKTWVFDFMLSNEYTIEVNGETLNKSNRVNCTWYGDNIAKLPDTDQLLNRKVKVYGKLKQSRWKNKFGRVNSKNVIIVTNFELSSDFKKTEENATTKD